MARYWKEIPETNGLYFASMGGMIKSKKRRTSHGGVLKPSYNRKGYQILSISIDGKRKMKQVHRLVAETFIPNPKNKPQVNHKNGIKDDNRVDNLEWVTNQENRNHAVENKLTASKLSKEDVIEIRSRYKEGGETYQDLASDYNCKKDNIGYVVRNETWKHV